MKKFTREEAESIFKQLSPEELALYKKLASTLSQPLSEANASDIKDAVQSIAKGWKGWSSAMLMALMMNSNIAKATNTYSPETYKAIDTEIAQDTVKVAPGQAVATTTIKGTSKIPGQRVVATVNIQQTFGSGKADVDTKTLQDEVAKIQQWVNANKGRKFKILITAGESQVTNPKGYEKKKADDAPLAQARAQAVERVLSKSINAPIDIVTKVGKIPYKQGKDNPQDSKYQEDQFITVDIIVDAKNICNFRPNDSGIQGKVANDYITFSEYISGEGSIVITPKEVPDRLIIVDANGNVKADTGYVTTQKSIYSANWNYVPKYVLELTKAHLNPKLTAVTGNKIKKIKANSYEELEAQLAAKPNPSVTGNEIRPALDELRKMIEDGVTEFVIYDNMGNNTVKFSEEAGDLKAIVHSVIGSTVYQLKGNCK